MNLFIHLFNPFLNSVQRAVSLDGDIKGSYAPVKIRVTDVGSFAGVRDTQTVRPQNRRESIYSCINVSSWFTVQFVYVLSLVHVNF